jgi:hypothetical protein
MVAKGVGALFGVTCFPNQLFGKHLRGREGEKEQGSATDLAGYTDLSTVQLNDGFGDR